MSVSRRRRQRQESSDIEEGNTQAPARDDVDEDEDEEEQPSRNRKRGSIKKQQPQDVDEDDDEDEGEPIDVENFPDQPLGEVEAAKLKGLASDWTMLIGAVMTNINAVGDVGAALLEHGDDADKEKWTNEVDAVMKEFIQLEATMTSHGESLDALYQAKAQGDEISGVVSQYNASVAKKESEYKQKTSRQKYAKHEQYMEFRQRLWEASHDPDQGMPPFSELIPAESGDESDDDDEVEIGGVTQDYKCPITLRTLENPVKSKTCGHMYSYSAIKEMFDSQHNAPISCPASGCHRKIRLADCIPDKELAKRIKEYARRQKKREEEMREVDEVIE